MKKLCVSTAVVVSLLAGAASSAHAQSYYHVGLRISSFTSSAAALSFVQNSLDARQQKHALVAPMPVIDGPLSSNPPDVISYVVVWQPSNNDDVSGMTDVSTTSQPATTWTTSQCFGFVGDSYGGFNLNASDALTSYATKAADIHDGPFVTLLPLPDIGSVPVYNHLVLFPVGGHVACR